MSIMIDHDEQHPLPEATAHSRRSPSGVDRSPLPQTTPQTLLIALDGSGNSDVAFDWGVSNLLKTGDNLILARVLEESAVADMFYADEVHGTNTLHDHLKHEASKVLDQYASRLQRLAPDVGDVAVTTKIKIGNPGEVLCEMADTLGVDKIVMGSHGFGLFKRMIFGSVSSYTMENAHVPVTIIKSHEGGLEVHEGGNKHRH